MSTTLLHPIPRQTALDVTRGAFDLHVHIDPDVQLFPGHSTDLPHDVPVPA